ncbi:unnamed protein product [marine sediment metagenome]|uniref:Uncharacterized protein n=1 Tax=marine sediment metagenome TaxID=412755 RepID=X1CTK0_9ZZZZ
MATVENIIQEVREEIDDQSFSATRLLALMNRGLETIAAGVFPEYPELPEICLAELEKFSTVDTGTTRMPVQMPTDYHKKLLSCHSSVQDSGVEILPSTDWLRRKDSALDGSGNVYWIALAGTSLYYQNIPSGFDRLTLQYFKKPNTLSFGSTSRNNWINMIGTSFYARNGRSDKALYHGIRAVTNFDGGQQLWALFSNLGFIFLTLGPLSAFNMFSTALSFYPESEEAKKGITFIEDMPNAKRIEEVVS